MGAIQNHSAQTAPKSVRVSVGVLILDAQNRVLLHKRRGTSHGNETWSLAGGWLEYGETPEEAMKRESLEEYGLTLDEVKVICMANEMGDGFHRINIGGVARKWHGTPQIMEPQKCAEIKWFALNALPENLFAPSAHIIENFRMARWY